MISFIKSNFNIILPILIIFFTIDMFMLLYKFYLSYIVNLNILINPSKCFYNKYEQILYIELNIENKSVNPTTILSIKLVNGSKTYLSSYYNFSTTNKISEESTNLNKIKLNQENKVDYENIKIPKNSTLKGYAIFYNISTIDNSQKYNLVLETTSKTFNQKLDNLIL